MWMQRIIGSRMLGNAFEQKMSKKINTNFGVQIVHTSHCYRRIPKVILMGPSEVSPAWSATALGANA